MDNNPSFCNMRIAIVAATAFEMEYLKATFQSNSHISFHVTGVGLLAASVAITRIALEYQPDFLLQVGIAGRFTEALPLGSVVIVGKDKCADEGVWENNQWRSLFSLGFADGNAAPYQAEWLVNNYLSTTNPPPLPIVTAITVNEITTNPQRIAQYQSMLNPALESMEGAALHYVGNLLHISYMQIRGISNQIGERDKSLWQIQSAIENSQLAAQRMIERLQ